LSIFDFFELFFAQLADRANPIVRQIFERGPRRNSLFGVPLGRVVDIFAAQTLVFGPFAVHIYIFALASIRCLGAECYNTAREQMLTALFAFIGLVMIMAGLVGIILPFIPAVPVAWLGLFIFSLGTGFHRISLAIVILFFALMLVTIAVDFLAPLLGAGKSKASKGGMFGSTAGSFLGFITLGRWGIVLGPFLGALLGELLGGRKEREALKIAWGALLGVIIGGIFKILVLLSMLGVLIASLF
jgi:uncharacterized protein YqgC (DUF456 family)